MVPRFARSLRSPLTFVFHRFVKHRHPLATSTKPNKSTRPTDARLEEIRKEDAIARMENAETIHSRREFLARIEDRIDADENSNTFLLFSPYENRDIVRFEIDEANDNATITRYSRTTEDVVWQAAIHWARSHYASLRTAGYLTTQEAFNS